MNKQDLNQGATCAGGCGMDRRAFIAQGVLAVAAVALAGCVPIDGPTSINGSIKVSDYPTLAATGGIALVSVSGTPLAIVRTGTATFVALSRSCPHQGTTVNTSGSGFQCPRHGAQFSATGAWVGGQPTTNLRSYTTSFDATTGTLTIA